MPARPAQQASIEFPGHLEAFPIDYVDYVHLARELDASLTTSDQGQKAAAAGFKVPLWEVPVAGD